MKRKTQDTNFEKLPGGLLPGTLDETDQKLIAQLLADPNTSNSKLASEAGISTKTVTSRLQKLLKYKVIKVAARLDIRMLGYSLVALVRIDSPTDEAIEALNAEYFVLGTYTAIVDNCVFMMAAFDELTWLNNKLAKLLDHYAPEATFVLSQCIESYKYDFNAAHLNYDQQTRATLKHYQNSKIDRIDKIDYGIIGCLMEDGRKSSRQIAKELSLTEKTVRTRTASLKEQQLIKVTTIINSQLHDKNNTLISGELSVSVSNLDAVVQLLKAHENIFFVVHTAGASNLNFGGVFSDKTRLQRLCRALDKLIKDKKIYFLNSDSAMLRYEFLPLL